ncbi:MAG: glutamine--fructose-6-phosphate transaminase (isomerizing) [Candidatus Kappaea frigidicola]|nr:glutamine--fructose-6-phosphate transaminase (isomerizing) [Candidatus Kappaea frigidicola]
MCGIVGYVGKKEVVPILIDGLRRLEYRGYDSAGIALLDKGKLTIAKSKGKLEFLDNSINRSHYSGTVGIGHTRWATHGEPSKANAHPHTDCSKKIAVVHNGIIENYLDLKDKLIREGHIFKTKTDSEVIVHLIEKYYNGNLEKAVLSSIRKLKGSYAIAVITKEEPHKIVAARCGSPLIVGIGKEENFVASDVPAVLTYTKKVMYLHDYEIAILSENEVQVKNIKGKNVSRRIEKITWDINAAEKGGYSHFMLKEIEEQADVISHIIKRRVDDKRRIFFDELNFKKNNFKAIKKITIIACGTAWHAGLIGKYLIEKYARVPVEVDLSSEYRYRNPPVLKNELVITVSQSGETADTLAALRLARRNRLKVITICNVVGSSMVRESDGVIYTHAGPEIGVASTKAYTAQVSIFYLFAIHLAFLKGIIGRNTEHKLVKELEKLPKLIMRVLNNKKDIEKCAKRYKQANSFLYLGRNINYPTALEGALKLKEISYIHAEGCSAGEMKHGPIALVDEKLPTVCLVPRSETYEKMLSNIQELKARRGIIISIATDRDNIIKRYSDYVIHIPKISEDLSAILAIIPLQLLAYYMAVVKGCDVDKPRNLAKSVTVE